jgi:hypothetical protein
MIFKPAINKPLLPCRYGMIVLKGIKLGCPDCVPPKLNMSPPILTIGKSFNTKILNSINVYDTRHNIGKARFLIEVFLIDIKHIEY